VLKTQICVTRPQCVNIYLCPIPPSDFGRPLSWLRWGWLLKTWLTLLLLFILLTYPIQFNLLILKMKLHLNLQISALIHCYIAFSNFDLLQFPQNILLKTSLSKAASRLAISLFSIQNPVPYFATGHINVL